MEQNLKDKKTKYRAGKPRFSTIYGYEVTDIYKREKLFGLIPYWKHCDTIKNAGQVDEVVMLLNNPGEFKNRVGEYLACL